MSVAHEMNRTLSSKTGYIRLEQCEIDKYDPLRGLLVEKALTSLRRVGIKPELLWMGAARRDQSKEY